MRARRPRHTAESAYRTSAPSDEAGAAGLARAFRRKCDGLLPRGCCAEELRSAVWQLLSYVLARAFAGSLSGPQLCAAVASGFSNDPNVDEETRTPARCAAESDHALTEVEWTGMYGPKPGPRRYGRREERVRQLLLSPAACGMLGSLAFDRMGASETLGELAHILFALLSACVTFGLTRVSAELARDAEHGKLLRRWGLSCPVGTTPKGIGGVVGLLALRGAEAMTGLLNYGRSLDRGCSAENPSFGQLAPLSDTAWRRNSAMEVWHLAPRPLLVRDGSNRLSAAGDNDLINHAEHTSLPWASWLDTPKRIFEELLAQTSGFAEPGVRWSKMASDLMENDDGESTCTPKLMEQNRWQPRRGYFSKVTLDSVGGRHCVVQLFVCPLRRGASSVEPSCELTAEAIAACRHSDGQTYRMLLPRQLAMSWVERATAVDGNSAIHYVLDAQAPGQYVLCDEPKALPQCMSSVEEASGFVKMLVGSTKSQALAGSPKKAKPSVDCCVEMLADVLFVDAPREPTVDYDAWEHWKCREDEAAAIRSKITSDLPQSRSRTATQTTTMTYMVDADNDVRVREAALDLRRKQRVDAIKLRFDELAEQTMDLTDDWNETEEDEEVRRARLRCERSGVQQLVREPEGVHRYAKVAVQCNAKWRGVTTGSAIEVEVTYRTRHASAWPDDHYLTQRGRLRFTLHPPAPGLQSFEGATEVQEIKVPLVYNQEAVRDESAAASSDPLHFKVLIDSAEVINGQDKAGARLGARCTTVFLKTMIQPHNDIVSKTKVEEQNPHVVQQWSPVNLSVPFCRTCGRIASGDDGAELWAECLHAHGLPQRLAQQPAICEEMSAASELAAAFAVQRLRTMDTGRAPKRRTQTIAQQQERQAIAQAELKARRQNFDPLQWLANVNEAKRVSELERVLQMIVKETGLEWADESYSESVWQRLALGLNDALYYLRVIVNRMTEHGIAYEPPANHASLDGKSSSNVDSTPHAGYGQPESQRVSDRSTSTTGGIGSSDSISPPPSKERSGNKARDSRATWMDFHRAVRKYIKVSSSELSDDELRDAYAIAADQDGTIERSEIAQMLAMTDAATALAKIQRGSIQSDSRSCSFHMNEKSAAVPGTESVKRLDAAARRLNLRYAFHVGALTHQEYTAAMDRLDHIQEEKHQQSLIDHRLLSPEISCSAETKAENMLPGVLSRSPGIEKATRTQTVGNGVRNLAEEWKQEMFDLTARKFWKPDPRLTVQQLSLALSHSGGDCDTRGWNGQTVLMCCAKTNFLEGALFLLHKGANRLLQNNRGWSALMLAAKYSHTEICVALLTAAIPVVRDNRQDGMRQRMLNQTNGSGDTALDIAIVNGMGACADLLAAYGAVVLRSLKDAATTLAGSGGWFHLAAAAAAAGDISSEATADAAEIEQIVQSSSFAALEKGRSTQLAEQNFLGRKLYGIKQPSGKILPAVAGQGWGPNVSEKVAHMARSKVFERDAEWVEMSGAQAPRAMHRQIALDTSLDLLSHWVTNTAMGKGQRTNEPKIQGVAGRSSKGAIIVSPSRRRGPG